MKTIARVRYTILVLVSGAVISVAKAADFDASAPANKFDLFRGNLRSGSFFGSGYQSIVKNLIYKSLNAVLWVVTAAAIINIIYSGYQLITSGGDTEKSTRAKRSLAYSVVGLIVAVSIFVIYNATKQLGAAAAAAS